MKDADVACIEGLDPPPTEDIVLSQVKEEIGDGVCLKGNVDTNLLEMEPPSRLEAIVKC